MAALPLAASGDSNSPALTWLCVACIWLGFGSFAVPMKWRSVTAAKVHPLVYQSYKTFWVLVTSHLVLFVEPYQVCWTWGIAGGLLWIPSGMCAVFAVQNAGVATAQAIWQVTIIVTSFVVGLAVIQDESMKTWYGASLAILALCVGVVGMTLSFALKPEPAPADLVKVDLRLEEGTERSGEPREAPAGAAKRSFIRGVCAALLTGVFGGWMYVPSHFAPYGGAKFTLSFAWGAVAANALIWLVFALLSCAVWKAPLPSPEFRVMAVPGMLSGCGWSLGNFCSLVVVQALGNGIGNSLGQSSVIVAGLWGIFLYREITGKAVIVWFFFLLVAVAGIVGITLEKN